MSRCCDRNMNDVISTRKMPSENMWRSRVFSGIFLVEMVSFMFLSQYSDTKSIFYFFYKIPNFLSSFRDVIHVSVLQYKMKMTSTVFLHSVRKRGSSNYSVRRTCVILSPLAHPAKCGATVLISTCVESFYTRGD